MARITPVDPAKADPKAKPHLENVEKALGTVPNLMKTLAHSPATLGAYLGFGQALGTGVLGGPLREQIALTVAGANTCAYCASAHTALGQLQGVGDEELSQNLVGDSGDPRTQAALSFARAIVENRGRVSDQDIADVRSAGFGDTEIVEIIGTVVINIFTNYVNHIADTEIDFPVVQIPEAAAV